jgi:hypothetical protein
MTLMVPIPAFNAGATMESYATTPKELADPLDCSSDDQEEGCRRPRPRPRNKDLGNGGVHSPSDTLCLCIQ